MKLVVIGWYLIISLSRSGMAVIPEPYITEEACLKAAQKVTEGGYFSMCVPLYREEE